MLLIGHRGAPSRTDTENTLGALRAAVDAGADGVEVDIRVSRDGEMVAFHDADLHRVAGNAHRVADLSVAELVALPLRHGGSIPTLAEITATIHAPTILDTEIKDQAAIELLITKLHTSASLRERTIVSSFSTPCLEQIQRALPDVRTLLLCTRWPIPLRRQRFFYRIQQLAPWGIAFPLVVISKTRIAELKDCQVQVGVWDQRGSVREAHRALELPLDFVILKNVRAAERFRQERK